MSASISFEHEIAETILVAHAGLEKAAKAYEEAVAVQTACQSEIPELVDLAVKTAAIEPSDRDAFASALADPVKALKLFKYALEQRSAGNGIQTKEVDGNGRVAATKQASHGARPNRYIGGGAGLAAANDAFDAAIGIS